MSKRDGGGSLANADVLLLESGNLADATIVCAHRTWNVHKLILSSRSKWFSTAFNGHLKVSTGLRTLDNLPLEKLTSSLVGGQDWQHRV